MIESDGFFTPQKKSDGFTVEQHTPYLHVESRGVIDCQLQMYFVANLIKPIGFGPV